MTIQKALPPRDNEERQYLSRIEGGRWLVITLDDVDASIQRLEDNKKARKKTD